jgi:glyoxylase-like metal-dependent hydrolase (beta-lactamase superfamily II)
MPQLTPHVYGILTQFKFMNAYLIQRQDHLTLVDTGLDASFVVAIEKELTALGKSWGDIRQIVLTHCHYDHINNLGAIQHKTSATTYAHRLDAPVIRGEQPVQYAKPVTLNFFERLILPSIPTVFNTGRVDVDVNDGDNLDAILPGAQVVHLPGHSFGQMGIWLPQEKTLIGGDVMFGLPWGLSVPFKMVSPDWDAAKTSIKKVASMNIENLCLGHGTPVIGNAHHQVQKLAQRLR